MPNYSTYTKEQYIEYIKLQLTAGVLELEISDEIIGKFVDNALQEVQRYIDEPRYITVPYASCIDLTDFPCSAVTNIYRTEGYTGDGGGEVTPFSEVDPMYAQSWMVFSNGGSYYNLNNYVYNYLAYNTLIQMRNTMSTELDFFEDKNDHKLYINAAYDRPVNITIQYIPIFKDVSEITSDYWIDILKRLALASTKIALGRVRTRFTQSNALWTQDGETLLQEGNEELKELRETLRVNSLLFFPRD